jgi:putative mycofactocin binding protein MftB
MVAVDAAYGLHPDVALRPEPFGALCYHYGNRRLTFLTSPDVVAVVEALADQPSVGDALKRAGVAERRWPSFLRALSSLEASEVIRAR